MLIRPAQAADIPAITRIYNHAVRHTLAIWNETEVDHTNRTLWWQARQAAGYPVLVAVDAQDTVLGYTSFGDWRAFEGYRHTAELAIYIDKDHQGQGVGKALLSALIESARACGKHMLVAAIEAQNQASIGLHHSLGFHISGHMAQVGIKNGQWLDLIWMQKQLDSDNTASD